MITPWKVRRKNRYEFEVYRREDGNVHVLGSFDREDRAEEFARFMNKEVEGEEE